MYKIIEKNNERRSINVIDGKAIITIQINGSWVSNPSLEQLYEDGWEEYIPEPDPQPHIPTQEENYHSLVETKIRRRFTVSDEIGLLRQRDTKPLEFAEYNTFVERCKQEAYNEIYTIVEEVEE